ncbi:hypothetical protein NXS19_001626 [Fusarium pseudograminearum]|nr:hypothetical protein NXS19_001626 [Fusarium pseudograminearum]
MSELELVLQRVQSSPVQPLAELNQKTCLISSLEFVNAPRSIISCKTRCHGSGLDLSAFDGHDTMHSTYLMTQAFGVPPICILQS